MICVLDVLGAEELQKEGAKGGRTDGIQETRALRIVARSFGATRILLSVLIGGNS